jgi:hypothetical protein
VFNAALVVRLQDIPFQKLPSLVTPVNPHAEVVELTDKALLPPYLKSLIVECATELFLQLADTLPKEESFDNEIQDMADASKAALLA